MHMEKSECLSTHAALSVQLCRVSLEFLCGVEPCIRSVGSAKVGFFAGKQ
jgi:hypothetical protein